jgi:SAM-dependent methyltransferase
VAVTEQAAESAQRVVQLFDAKAPTWQAKYAPAGRLADRLVRLAGAVGQHTRRGGSILDLGCGTGELARDLAAAGLRVTGADISPQMLGRAVTADQDGAVEWVQLDPGWRALPFASRAFDAVVASSVLEYVDEPAAVLSECARVLRPGGALLVTVPDIRHPVRWAEWAASLTARLPPARAGLGALPRLHGYLAYLRVSRQRHLLRWWHAAARRAGLSAVPAPEGKRRPATLRVLAFRRPGDQGEAS